MGELGLLGLRVPAALGGQEADLVTVGIAMEEIARGDFTCTYGIQLVDAGRRDHRQARRRRAHASAGCRP